MTVTSCLSQILTSNALSATVPASGPEMMRLFGDTLCHLCPFLLNSPHFVSSLLEARWAELSNAPRGRLTAHCNEAGYHTPRGCLCSLWPFSFSFYGKALPACSALLLPFLVEASFLHPFSGNVQSTTPLLFMHHVACSTRKSTYKNHSLISKDKNKNEL